MRARGWFAAAAAVVIVLLAGCGSGVGGSSSAQGSTSKGSSAPSQAPASKASTTEAGELNRCTLLTDAEIQDAIGPHRPGSSDLDNVWGLESCRWTATTAQKVQAYPDGWFDMIEVAVFDKNMESWASGEARGEPVTGFVDGALYDQSSGDLWFACARDGFCAVKARTNDDTNREAIARRIARLVEGRLR